MQLQTSQQCQPAVGGAERQYGTTLPAYDHKMQKDDLLHLFDGEMSQQAGAGRLSAQLMDSCVRQPETTRGLVAQANSLDRMQKRLSLLLSTHAGTVHCVEIHTHTHTHTPRLTSLTSTCAHSRWHNRPARHLCLLKARYQRRQHSELR